ncbi:ribonuclease E/G [Kribbella sandramycini]|uniref:Ribonuclease E n=1 Tax=Kribbella sandramycini TaxID=60450 RepID=A0A7Y4NYS0_9ACTN|nr:Rne/Rng family ribonuclease [Kribbella sandramycini]MBB6567965.1 ribonuclease E [Kribbella sandramycini]NOL39440.1 ribonuclease E/G [Kribbella sandramycini]
MLDNEPTTEAAETATAPAKKAARKTVAKKAATPRKRVAKKVADVPTQSDDATADPAPKTAAKKTAAKKAVAKKAPAKAAASVKKTAAKRAAKKTAEPEAPTALADAGPVTEAAPAKKAPARKRTAKKAAATLVATDTPLTDGPVADAEHPTTPEPALTRRTRTRRSTVADTTASAVEATTTTDTTAATAEASPAPKRSLTFTGTSHVVSPTTEPAAPAPTADQAASAPAPATDQAAPAKRSSRRRGKAADEAAPASNADQAASGAAAEQAAPAARSSRRRGKAAEAAADEPAAPLFPSADEPAAEVAEEAEPTTRRTRRRAPAAAAVLFQAPTVPSKGAPAEAAPAAEPAAEDEEQPATTRRRRSRRGRDAEEVVEPVVATDEDEEETEEDAEAVEAEVDAEEQTDAVEDGDESGEGSRRRRRRRGGRRRRKTGDADDEAEDSADEQDGDDAEPAAEDESDEQTDSAEDGEEGSSSRRRRRRRRRKGEEGTGSADDPDETVVRVREPRSKNTANEVTAIEGSTRLEAKKQRRREGRAAGRRRAPIVTEAEFLARRESVERTMVIRSREDLTQIAVSEDNVLVEHYVAQAEHTSLIGNVYLGRVQNVLPSMEAAFIDIGKGRNAVLYAGEVDWATLGGANGPRKIEQVLKSGQAVLVQVTKDPIGHKGARLTNQISLPGRYVVYVPRGGNGGISRKLPDTERNRLKTILKDIVPDEAGVIVRTAAEGASEEELTADVSRLQAAWAEIDKKSKNGQAPQLLYGEPDLLIRVVRDLFTEDFAKLVISGDRAFDQVREYVTGVAPHLADRVEKWTGDSDVFANFRIDEQIKKALDRKVWLPSGGSLIIDRTEAMTVVDVNTGKFTGSGGNLEETVTKNNLEAAEEIVRQLRLRDIGGIIVIDFIDMVLESNRDLVLRRLVECLGRDRTKHQVAEVTSLGLVQMTRKRIGTGLLEAFSENCDHCGGRGLILHDEPKESRRRDGGRGGNNGGGNGGGGNGNGNGSQEQKPAAQSDEGGRSKSSRRRRGKNRGDDEQPAEADHAHQNGDAAQRLAEIAAASAKKDDETAADHSANGSAGNGANGSAGNGGESGTPEPTGYPASDTEAATSPEATGFPTAEGAGDGVPAADGDGGEQAAKNGSKSTRRRRSSRGRGKAATDAPEAPAELVPAGQ